MRRSDVSRLLWLLLLLLLSTGTAQAHKLKLFASVDGGRIDAYAYFPGGSSARGIPVRLLDGSGRLLSEVTTDGDGRASLAYSSAAARLSADSLDGHLAEFILTDSMGTAPASGSSQSTEATTPVDTRVLDQVVARHVGPLREQLQRLEEQRQWRDILGGLGYLIGLAGVGFYLSARKKMT